MIRARSPSDAVQVNRPTRQDTFDLRGQITVDTQQTEHIQQQQQQHPHQQQHYHNEFQTSDEEQSVLDEDDGIDEGEFMEEEETSSSLSVPNDIDFDLVYAFHSFAATVDGQANVVKGDSLKLMDDTNSYWWLVNVLNTQEIGYIPAENIETPLERLARLNKHRNVDLAAATQQELAEDTRRTRERLRGRTTPQEAQLRNRVVVDDDRVTIHNYLPAIWNSDQEYDENEDEEMETDEEEGGVEINVSGADESQTGSTHLRLDSEDDGMQWVESAVAEEQSAPLTVRNQQQSPQSLQQQQQQHYIQQQQAQQQQIQQQRPQPAQQTEPQIRINQQAQIGLGQPSLRQQTSRERLMGSQTPPQDAPRTGQTNQQLSPILDPEEATGTTRRTLTPTLAQDPPIALQTSAGRAPNIIVGSEYQTEQRASPKRGRDGTDSPYDDSSKRQQRAKEPDRALARSVSNESGFSSTSAGPAKLRKEREKPVEKRDDAKEEKKKKGSVLSSIFGRKKDKGQSGDSTSSIGDLRRSEDSNLSTSLHGHSVESINSQTGGFSTPPRQTAGISSQDIFGKNAAKQPPKESNNGESPIDQQRRKLQQEDQAHMQRYQRQHLTPGPGSPENKPVTPSFGLQSESEYLSGVLRTPNAKTGSTPDKENSQRRSLLLSPTSADTSGISMPQLTVIRVFAGAGIQTEATFKTVLLNASTTSDDLVKQAMQRFRLAGGDNPEDYYLSVKQLEGRSAELKADEQPLRVFEGLVESALPKVNRNSVGSISSVSSNLSMHPAIRKLPMNDFTDDSAVKFYLNRRGAEDVEGETDHSALLEKGDTVHPNALNPERFSSPSVRFSLQLFIYPEDLPDGLVFDPQTEAIIPKSTLRDRSQSNGSISSGVSPSRRKKLLNFPKNTTVAEVIELGLERFGILEGVADGGDDIEDKVTKRRSHIRVRYGLSVSADGQEKSLLPTAKVLDAFSAPPIFKDVDRRSIERRRSADSALLLGAVEDIRPSDPTFVLRRIAGSRLSVASSRHSAPLDELALHRLHRDSTLSSSVTSSFRNEEDDDPTITLKSSKKEADKKALSPQELIKRQREESRANQRALIANTNQERGTDLLLPDQAVLRSSRDMSDSRLRYSMVEANGDTYDIGPIIEEEIAHERKGEGGPSGIDLIEQVLANDAEKLSRVVNRVRTQKITIPEPTPSSTMETILTASASTKSAYSDDASSKRASSPLHSLQTDGSAVAAARAASPTNPYASSSSREATPVSRYYTPVGGGPSSRTATPVQVPRNRSGTPTSIAQMIQPHMPGQGRQTPTPKPRAPTPQIQKEAPPLQPADKPQISIPPDLWGIDKMCKIIEAGSILQRPLPPKKQDPLDRKIFGPRVDLNHLHPAIREIYAPSFKALQDIDDQLDALLLQMFPNKPTTSRSEK